VKRTLFTTPFLFTLTSPRLTWGYRSKGEEVKRDIGVLKLSKKV
jgi:hypothetical protein